MAKQEHWKVQVKEGFVGKTSYRGKIFVAGDEFVIARERKKIPPHLVVIEEVELTPDFKVKVTPVKSETEQLAISQEVIKVPEGNTVIATPEGTEIVTLGTNLSEAAIKAQILETESSKATVVKDTSVGAPIAAKFAATDKGGGWYQVINVDTGEVVSDKSLRKDAAEEFAAQLIEAAAGSVE